MRKKTLLLMALIFCLMAMQIFANSYSSDDVTITWDNKCVRVDNHNTMGVTVYFSIELSNGTFEHFNQPITGESAWQWNIPDDDVTIIEMRSINITVNKK